MSLAYEEYVNVFLENNYRVITYDQYGRGYSDRVVNNVNIEQNVNDNISDLIITIDENQIVVSNGLLIDEINLENNLKQYHWKESYPIATYL